MFLKVYLKIKFLFIVSVMNYLERNFFELFKSYLISIVNILKQLASKRSEQETQ